MRKILLVLVLSVVGSYLKVSAQNDDVDLEAFGARSATVVQTAQIHFRFAEYLRFVSVAPIDQLGALAEPMAAAFDRVEDGSQAAEEAYFSAVVEYQNYSESLQAEVSERINQATNAAELFPFAVREDAIELIELAETGWTDGRNRLDTLAEDVWAYADGEDGTLIGGDISAELQRLLAPIMSAAASFAERSYIYEASAIQPFLLEDSISVQLGLSPQYLAQMVHVSQQVVRLPNALLELSCLEGEHDTLQLEPLTDIVDILSLAFSSPDDIDADASGFTFLILLQGDGPSISALTAPSRVKDALSTLIGYEVESLKVVDKFQASLSDGDFSTCAAAIENKKVLADFSENMLGYISLDSSRSEYRATVYDEAISFYQGLAGDG
ncbi:MAG: hypothetical protein AAF498_05875 [Pseudomonadota bacterium]